MNRQRVDRAPMRRPNQISLGGQKVLAPQAIKIFEVVDNSQSLSAVQSECSSGCTLNWKPVKRLNRKKVAG
jgi:hypothetical protein